MHFEFLFCHKLQTWLAKLVSDHTDQYQLNEQNAYNYFYFIMAVRNYCVWFRLHELNGSFASSHFILKNRLFQKDISSAIIIHQNKKSDDDSQILCAPQFFVQLPIQKIMIIIIINPVPVLSFTFHGRRFFFYLDPFKQFIIISIRIWPQERSENDSTEIITEMSLRFVQFAETSRNAKNDLTIE